MATINNSSTAATFNATKASLFNFIVYVPTKERAQYFNEIIQTVLERFPCRIILIENNEAYTKNVAVQTSTTTTAQGDTSIICDRVTIQAGGNSLSQVPYLVLPQLLPDLPVYLLWGQDPSTEKTILPHLTDYASRLIFDSECIQNLQEFCPKILAMLNTFKCDIIDTNWARFAGWRRILAQMFNTPKEIEMLRQTKSISITYNGPGNKSYHTQMLQALYFQAWLATQMGWKFKKKDHDDKTLKFYYTLSGNTIAVSFHGASSHHFTPGALLGVQIESFDGDHFACKRIETSPLQVRVEMSSIECCKIPLSLPLTSRNTGYSFIREILYASSSNHYEEMLETLKDE
jgi:glucose-6-phosphate dehydrogenase assembly protein OpcA